MKITILFFLILFVQNLKGQISDDSIQKSLASNQFDDILRIGNNLQIIEHLLNIRLSDTITSNQIWFSESTVDPNKSQRNYFIADKRFVSIKIKAFFWIWLIYNQKEGDYMKTAVLVDECSNENILDYEILYNSTYRYVKKEINMLKELEHAFECWLSLVNEKGLKYVQKKNIFPFVGRCHFEIMSDR